MTKPAGSLTLAVFFLTSFLSGAALFMLQPMLGKALPSAHGWITALSFYQAMILMGAGFSYLLARCRIGVHAMSYFALLCLGFAFLPVRGSPALAEATGPASLFLPLMIVAGAPLVAMSATVSIVQRLFATAAHPRAQNADFIYIASYLGGFAGLVAYPLLIEPVMPLEIQARAWRAVYALVLFVAVTACLRLSRGKEEASAPEADRRTRFLWTALAFLPAALMSGVTLAITADVLPAAILRVLPLALYLLTLILVFSSHTPRFLGLSRRIAFAAAFILISVFVIDQGMLDGANAWPVPLYLAGFFTLALYAHACLARMRPESAGQRPEFYFFLSLGGALGTALIAFALPVFLNMSAVFGLSGKPDKPDAVLTALFDASAPRRVGVVGLGSGAMACHDVPGRSFTFFEARPDIIRSAQHKFTYLQDCQKGGPARIVSGDARRSLARLDEKFDLLIFNGAAPHLLTREAMELYRDRLEWNGMMAFRFTDKLFDLTGPIFAAGYALDMDVRVLSDSKGATRRDWVLLSPHQSLWRMEAFEFSKPARDNTPAWTDSLSNTAGALRLWKKILMKKTEL